MATSVRPGVQGGLVLPGDKQRAAAEPLGVASVPAQLVLSLEQADGEVLVPCVSAGDIVRRGQVVAWPTGNRSVPLHSPVSGRIAQVEVRDAIGSTGGVQTLLIDNDGRDDSDPSLVGIGDYTQRAPEELLARIAAGGIVGLGGAGFPTHLKLAPRAANPIVSLLINGVECEPGISCDDALMRQRAEAVVFGAQVMLHILGATHCTIAIEADKPEAIATMQAAVRAAADERMTVTPVPIYYPAGGERQVIALLWGKEVPAGGLPRDVGVICQNVGTAAAIATLVRTGEPLIRRIVTVTGSGVRQPRNLEARLGTPVSHLISECGGYTSDVSRLIAGGSMMGQALPHDDFGIGKATNCIIAATPADTAPRGPEMPCIRCGDCAGVCPAGLLPQELYRYARRGDEANLARYGVIDCIECGCCDVVCPSQLSLTAVFKAARARLTAAAAETERRMLARCRFEAHTQRLTAEQAERQRKLKEKRSGGR